MRGYNFGFLWEKNGARQRAAGRRRIIPAVCLCLALISAGCSESPSPSPAVSVSPSPIVPPSPSPVVPSDTEPPPSDEPHVPITPVPSPEIIKEWPVNEEVRDGVTSWNQTYADDAGTYMTASIHLPALEGVPQTVTDYYEAVLEDYQAKCDILAEEAKEGRQDSVMRRPYDIRQDYYIECNSGGFISIRRVEAADYGGSHPDMYLACDSFRVSDGQRLGLDDFFSVSREEYYPVLLEQVKTLLLERAEDFYEDWETTAEILFPFEAFCMTQGGLSLFYPELSIAPYATGIVRVDIPWESVEGLWILP